MTEATAGRHNDAVYQRLRDDIIMDPLPPGEHLSALAARLDVSRSRVRDAALFAMQTTVVTAGPHRVLDDDRAILAAFEAGDPAAAEQAARTHVARLRQNFLVRAQNEPVAG